MKPRLLLNRRATSALAAAGLVLTLAACGSDDEPEVEPADPQTAVEAETSDGAGDETSGDDAASVRSEGVDETAGDGAAGGDDPTDATTGGTGESTDGGATGDEGSDDGTGADDGTAGSDDDGTAAAGDSGVEADIEAARAGLARYLEANMPETPQTSTNIPGCPAIEQTVLEAALAGVGYPDTVLGGWTTEIEWDEYEDVGDDVIGIVCGGDSDGDPNNSDYGVASGIAAVDLKGTAATPDMLFPGAEVQPGHAELGGEVVTMCDDDLCFALWNRDDLVIGTVLNTAGVDEASARALLDATLPTILETLATN
ncbi:hypothetical protein FNH13_03880 [Ornithinimicrobium ciconiae]|uniref:Uncharacterized protein n=1 Tax=Ornithinimicrobium ciconiae TaxID=2594265 RepID=A0A516G7T6_9MICO|nr:hypothetical protein [Ornithinimicrobium ciconiae]QDO87581.1 hypothetical protein FNH13_03880 [Ornithinimicrobium ciconiae]